MQLAHHSFMYSTDGDGVASAGRGPVGMGLGETEGALSARGLQGGKPGGKTDETGF